MHTHDALHYGPSSECVFGLVKYWVKVEQTAVTIMYHTGYYCLLPWSIHFITVGGGIDALPGNIIHKQYPSCPSVVGPGYGTK